jgi:hypothetical protein
MSSVPYHTRNNVNQTDFIIKPFINVFSLFNKHIMYIYLKCIYLYLYTGSTYKHVTPKRFLKSNQKITYSILTHFYSF